MRVPPRPLLWAFVLLPSIASAQNPFETNPYEQPRTAPPGGCTPYVPPGCLSTPLAPDNPVTNPGGIVYTSRFDFAEVQIGQIGADNDYMAFVPLKNLTPTESAATITVTWEGSVPVTRIVVVPPRLRLTVKLNDWPELATFQGAVSVEVRMHQEGLAGVVMRSERDFWRTFTVLEGR